MSEEFADDFLEHYGKLGMKWGRRSAAPATATNSQPGASRDAKHVTAITKKVKAGGTQALSNRELKDLTTRMNLEKQYASLRPTPGYQKAVKWGAKQAGDVLTNVGKQQAANVLNKYANVGITKLLKAAGL